MMLFSAVCRAVVLAAPELLHGAGFGEAARAVHAHQNLDRFQHLMSRVTRLRAHLRPHAVADLLAASDGRIQFVGGAARLQMGGRMS